MTDGIGAELQADIERTARIESIPTILEVVCRTTRMRFAAVARVTADRWIACSVLDEINFGLKAGGELSVETTICNQIRQSREPVIIDNVEEDTAWCKHPTPAMYGFKSYISMPIILADGSLFGTLCAIDPLPARLNTPETIGMFRLFAELIAKHLETTRKLAVTESALIDEREAAELREQFIAVVGHDLRTPMRAIRCFAELLLKTPLNASALEMAGMIRNSAMRMQVLIDNLLDLARGRLAGGLSLDYGSGIALEPVLQNVVAELKARHPERVVHTTWSLKQPVRCDQSRIAQLLSNLLGNALAYGSNEPVLVEAISNAQCFELSVANCGDPIPQAALSRIFEPFYRGLGSHDHEGLGLGLYIAHEIAKAHRGVLTVKSTPEETRFTLHIPTA